MPAIEADAGDAARMVACFSKGIGLARAFFSAQRMLDRDARKAYLERRFASSSAPLISVKRRDTVEGKLGDSGPVVRR
jgi:hypothetical protein